MIILSSPSFIFLITSLFFFTLFLNTSLFSLLFGFDYLSSFLIIFFDTFPPLTIQFRRTLLSFDSFFFFLLFVQLILAPDFETDSTLILFLPQYLALTNSSPVRKDRTHICVMRTRLSSEVVMKATVVDLSQPQIALYIIQFFSFAPGR